MSTGSPLTCDFCERDIPESQRGHLYRALAAIAVIQTEMRRVESEHRAKGPDRTVDDVLDGGLASIAALFNMLKSLNISIPAPLAITFEAMTQHRDKHFPRTAPMFIPPAMRKGKSDPKGWNTNINKALLSALCEVLHRDGLTVDAACQRIAVELERAGLRFEDGRTRGTKTSVVRTAQRLDKWRNAAQRGQFKREQALFENAKGVTKAALAVIRAHEPAALVHEILIKNAVARIANNTVRVGPTDPM